MLVMLVSALVACSKGGEQAVPDTAAAATAPVAWSYDAPARWGDRVRIEDLPAAMNGRARSSRAFHFVPADSSIGSQILLVIAVYDTASWNAVVAEGGPPQGDTLVTSDQHVFVAALPQSNPFAPGSRDALAFDSLSVTLDEARKGFRILK
jgi:hypothetical protein